MRSIWTVLLAAVVLAALLLPGLGAPTAPPERTLVVLSPHWDGIREEFKRAFAEHHKRATGETVAVEFYDVGGTGEIRRFLQERVRRVDWGGGEGVGADILFGGGTFDFQRFAKDGVLEPYNPAAVRDGRVPAAVNGQPLRDEEGAWHAACLSGFGIVYNKEVLARAKLPPVNTWADLARPEMFGWVSCGDPTKSGSVHMAFEIVLQAYGWEKGWGVLARTCANVRAFNEGGSSVPRDVSLGQCAAGPCIDFYAAAPVRRQGAEHLVFVFPDGLSVITPDAIAIIRHSEKRELAQAFVDFVLSEEGQKLWYLKRGAPEGPVDFDLERLPVWPALYDQKLPTHTVARPFEEGQSFPYDDRKGGRRWRLIEDLFKAALLDVHEDLKSAWSAVIAAGRTEELGAELGRPPLGEEDLFAVGGAKLSPGEMNRLRHRWTGWARARFATIRAAAESGGPAPAYEPAPVRP